MKKLPPIPHVAWRDGRPRFSPGPKVRPHGFKGKDLRHADGTWFTRGEAVDFSDAIAKEIAEAKAKVRTRSARRAAPGRAPGGYYSIEMLIEDWFRSPRFTGGASLGRQSVKIYSPNTIRDYRQKARAFQQHDPDLYGASVNILDRKIVFGLYESLWQQRGLATARGVIATLSTALSWGMKRQVAVKLTTNPAASLGMQTAKPRIRVGDRTEMLHLIAAADAIGRPEAGDCIALRLWTGQRQNDRLALVDRGMVDGRRMFRQSKTGVVVEILQAPDLAARLKAAAERRRKAQLVNPFVVLDEANWQPFKADWWRKVYARVRAAASEGIVDQEATERARIAHRLSGREGEPPTVYSLSPMPSLADFRDQDLRDTAVTWMARGGATIPQIISVSGHSAASAHEILKHYLSQSAALGDEAIRQMIEWYDGEADAAGKDGASS